MYAHSRRSTPEVVGGKVQKKNNWDLSEDYYDAPNTRMVVVDRKRPGAGFRHVLTRRDIYDFIAILPDWDELARGLNAIVLAPGDDGTDGYHAPGVVHVCAWEANLWRRTGETYYRDHADIFARVGVDCEPEDGGYLCKFDAKSVRAYQLLHILLHELGHHHDRMTTRSQRQASRGETYAEAYARQYELQIWKRYLQTFDLY